MTTTTQEVPVRDDTPTIGQSAQGGRVKRPADTWSQVPHWVLLCDVSAQAIRLYATLWMHADWGDAKCVVKRRTLADEMKCSPSTVDRAAGELAEVGALTLVPTYDAHGDRGPNIYELSRERPDSGRGVTARDEGGVTARGDTESQIDLERQALTETTSPSELVRAQRAREGNVGRCPAKVDRKVVVASEAELAVAVLDEWNRATGQSLASKDWLAKIIMRVREYPALALDDHAHVIAAALADPWWKGSPTPSVVYGNGAVFERATLAARGGSGPQKPPPRRYGRGLTTKEIRDREGVV